MNYQAIFESVPDNYLILKPDFPTFTILAVSDCYNKATFTKREEIIGKPLFEVFPDNPEDKTAKGVENLTRSLVAVITKKEPNRMATQKYDVINHSTGKFEEKYWEPLNLPVLSPAGEIDYIIHSVKDVTELVKVQEKVKVTTDLFIQAIKLNDMYYEKLKGL